MRTPIGPLLTSLLAGFGLAACSGGSPAVLTGAITQGQYALDNPVVIATSLGGATYLSHIQRDGTFRLTVPVGATYALSLANTVAPGKYGTMSRIDWGTADGAVRYLSIAKGGTIALGHVSRLSYVASAGGLQTQSKPLDENGSDDGDAETSDDDGAPKEIDDCEAPELSDSHCEHDVDSDHGHQGGHDKAAASDTTSDEKDGSNGAGETKVAVCHIPPGNPANAHTIVVGAPAVPAHLAHGDYLGECLDAAPTVPPSCGDTPTVTVTPPVSTPETPTPTSTTPPSTTTPTPTTATPTTGPKPCVVNADCSAGEACVDSACGFLVL